MDKPFKTDGCSASLDLDQWKCCVPHDWAYWQGGTFWQKCLADWAFAECIWKNSKYWWTAPHRFLGVFIFGWFPHPNFRWGYGWNWPQCKDRGRYSGFTARNQFDKYRRVLKRGQRSKHSQTR